MDANIQHWNERRNSVSRKHKTSIPIILLTNKSNFLVLNNPSSINTVTSLVPPIAIAWLLSA